MPGSDRTIVRPLSTQADYQAAVSLQEDIWGADVGETVPACVMQVSKEVGGIADGAFTMDGELVGFVFGMTGLRDGMLAHWSHLLAVREEWRNCGVGRQLKIHQRERLLELGVSSMLWTFDPLESRNAHLNLNKLGATVERYIPDFYGNNATAKTDTIIGTDRFVVRWDLKSSRRSLVARDVPVTDIPCVSVRPGSRDAERVQGSGLVRSRCVRVEVPANIQELKSSDPEASVAWRDTTRHAFVHYLDLGYRVAEFRYDTEAHEGCYVLEAVKERMLSDDGKLP